MSAEKADEMFEQGAGWSMLINWFTYLISVSFMIWNCWKGNVIGAAMNLLISYTSLLIIATIGICILDERREQ